MPEEYNESLFSRKKAVVVEERKFRSHFNGTDDVADVLLNTQGWVIKSDQVKGNTIIPFTCPQGLKEIEVEPHKTQIGNVNNRLIYDPTLTDLQIVKWGEGSRFEAENPKDKFSRLEKEGYSVVDSNIGRSILIKSQVVSVAIPANLLQKSEVRSVLNTEPLPKPK